VEGRAAFLKSQKLKPMLAARKIVILMATYNGEKYLCDQLKSIQRQTISNWKLLVRDDGSQDGTKEVLRSFAKKDSRIRYVQDRLGCLGTTGNFGVLMRAASAEGADAIFFCDQDDIWLPSKIATQVYSLQEMEGQHAPGTPLLCYSDLEVVDQDLHRIHPSFMRYEKLAHEPHNPLHVLSTQNFVTGCAVLINRALLEFATPIPDGIMLHDWWLALCAAACGRIGYVDEPLVQYRQHSRNQIGAVTLDRLVNLSAARRRLSNIREYMFGTIRQAQALRERIGANTLRCASGNLELIDGLVLCLQHGTVRRIWTIYRLPLRRQGPWRKLLLFLRVLLMRKGVDATLTPHRPPLDATVVLRAESAAASPSAQSHQRWPVVSARKKRRRVASARIDGNIL
jgi:glycosyltransferase involved in cell wall biosynthesis